MIIADEHKGLKAAAAKVLGATIQRCPVHFMRNALACVGKKDRPKKDRPIVTAALGSGPIHSITSAAISLHFSGLGRAANSGSICKRPKTLK